MQREKDEKHRLAACGSRSLIPPETRYAATELECLAIHFACEHASFYLTGAAHFTIYTDHRALVGLFNKPLPDVPNDRVARYREKLQGLNFSIEWVPGKSHTMADALSRAPAFHPDATDDNERLSPRRLSILNSQTWLRTRNKTRSTSSCWQQ